MATYTGTAGDDTLLGGTGNDIIDGLAGNDQLFGYEGDDSITGGAGDDHLWGGMGNDTLDGGDGSDAVYYSDASAAVTLNLALGTASGTGSDTDTLISIEIVYGSSFGDLLIGSSINDILYGQDGNDTLDGGPGNDQIYGGNGNDLLVGGAGSDYFQFRTTSADTSTDTVTDFQAGLGGDWLSIPTWLFSNYQRTANPFSSGHARLTRSSANTLVEVDVDGSSGPAGFETIAILTNVSVSSLVASNLGGFVPISLLGTAGANTLTGTAGNDNISGMAGNDTLSGGAGNDWLDGGSGTDTVQYSGMTSEYTITKLASGYSVTAKTGTDGTDTLINVERIKFSNSTLPLDVGATQATGGAMLLLGAVLPGTLVFADDKQALRSAVIDLFDQGYSLQTLAGAIMRLPIWDVLTGNAIPSNTDIASYLLTNVNGAAPNATTLTSAVAALNTETDFASQGHFLAQLAESSANQARVDLVGLATNGLPLNF
jgi:Ca2+-binding RTX toxin-like protein